MPRKSRSQRLQESKNLFESYKGSGIENGYKGRFISEMIGRLESEKTLTSKQKSWLDSLIDEGIPADKGDPQLIEKIRNAMSVQGMSQYHLKILGEFLGKIRRGWELSPKQMSWMDGIISESNKIKEAGPYIPCEDTVEKLKQCLKISQSYSSIYWTTHSGTLSALNSVREWLNCGGYIDEWCVNKVLKTMGSRLRELNESPYVNEGDLVWYRHPSLSGDLSMGIVSGNPSINDRGEIVYTILANGEIIETTKSRLAKRKSK